MSPLASPSGLNLCYGQGRSNPVKVGVLQFVGPDPPPTSDAGTALDCTMGLPCELEHIL